jgi:ATP-binding cassette subfamily F protein uup
VEYAGGYSDMLAQRGDAAPPVSVKSGKPRAALAQTTEATGKPVARKMSFKDQHALKNLPAAMEALHRRIEANQAAMADPALFTRDPARFAALSDALAADGQALQEAEERWLELEMLRVEIEG